MKNLNETNIKWIMLLILGILAIYQFKYRLNHPEMTETQLLINFFEAFKE